MTVVNLYATVARMTLEDNAAAVLAVLHDQPGASASTLADETGLSVPQVRRALAWLVDEGEVRVTEAGARVLAEAAPEDARRRPGLSAIERREDQIEWLDETPVSPSLRSMARCYGVSLPVIQADIRMLERSGVVTLDRSRARAHQVVLTHSAVWRDPARGRALSESVHPRRRGEDRAPHDQGEQ